MRVGSDGPHMEFSSATCSLPTKFAFSSNLKDSSFPLFLGTPPLTSATMMACFCRPNIGLYLSSCVAICSVWMVLPLGFPPQSPRSPPSLFVQRELRHFRCSFLFLFSYYRILLSGPSTMTKRPIEFLFFQD